MDLSLSRSRAQFLTKIAIFSALSPDELSELLRTSRPFSRNPGEILFTEGDPADGMYVVERGEVSVTALGRRKDPVMLAMLGNGSVIGEMSLLDGGTRSATVEATAQTNGYWFSRRHFKELRQARNIAAYKALRAIARELEARRRVTAQRVVSLMGSSSLDVTLHSPQLKEMIARLYKA